MATLESYDDKSYGDDCANESSESVDNHTEGVSEDDSPAAAVAPLPDAIVVAQDAAAGAGRGDEEDVAPPSMVEGMVEGQGEDGWEGEVEQQREVMVVVVGTVRGVVPWDVRVIPQQRLITCLSWLGNIFPFLDSSGN